MDTNTERAVSPVVGVILTVALSVVLAVAVGVVVLDMGETTTDGGTQESLGVRTAYDAAEETATVRVITGESDELRVLVNGSAVETQSGLGPGDEVTVSAKPAATITVVSVADGTERIVARERRVTTGDGTSETVETGSPTPTPTPTPEPNDPPTADAGTATTVAEDTSITFDASGSNDPDGDSLTYV
jgi:flagellin-like protein